MIHRYNHKTHAAWLLLAVLGLMHLGSRITSASTSCNMLEFSTTVSPTVISYFSRDVGVGDFNSDGKMDAVIISPTTGPLGISIALGDGNGRLGFAYPYYTGGLYPSGLAVGDFNGDGRLDVATGGLGGTRIAILYGNGDGFFSSLSYFETGFENPNAVGGATDVNSDGLIDLVVTNRDNNTIQILFNRGNGQMKFSAPHAVGTSPRGVIAGDFNGDGKIDIATANHDSGNVSVLFGIDGTGSFGAATNYDVGQLPYAIVAADFNSDGKADFAVASDEHVTVLANDGVGFTAPVDFLAGGSDIPTSLTVGDFNADNKIDIAIAEYGESLGGVSVLLGTGTGDFLSAISFGMLASGLRTVAAADFNGDGRTDLVTHDNSVLKLLTSKCATPSHKIDYDGDNKTDIAVWRPSEGNWYILNSSFNTFRVEHWGLGSLGDKPVPGDYDGDGVADLAVFRSSTGTWYIRNSSDGSIQTHHFGAPGDRPVQGDYDGDLKTDVAVWRPADGTWYIQHSSDGTVRAQQWGRGDLGDQPVQADYDFDGKTDVAVLRTAEHRWFISNSSNGVLRDVVWGTTGDVSLVFGMGGKADIAMWRPSNNAWYFYQGGFVGMQGNGDMPVPGDYDGDGVTDAAAVHSATGSWFINRSGNVPISYHFGSAGDIPVSVPYVLDQ